MVDFLLVRAEMKGTVVDIGETVGTTIAGIIEDLSIVVDLDLEEGFVELLRTFRVGPQ